MMTDPSIAKFECVEVDMQREIKKILIDASNGSIGSETISDGRSCYASLQWLHSHLPFEREEVQRINRRQPLMDSLFTLIETLPPETPFRFDMVKTGFEWLSDLRFDRAELAFEEMFFHWAKSKQLGIDAAPNREYWVGVRVPPPSNPELEAFYEKSHHRISERLIAIIRSNGVGTAHNPRDNWVKKFYMENYDRLLKYPTKEDTVVCAPEALSE